MQSPAIEITDLRKTYRKSGKGAGETEALKGASLSIPQGEFFALLGPNGAGKTTMIGILTGLVVKTSGEVKVHGVSIDENLSLAKTYIGVVPQEFNFSIFEKVIDIVVDQAGYYGIPRDEAMKRAEVLLKDLGIWEKRNDKSQALSGGMKRRLMIARALIHKPAILLLDEPTAGVDVELRRGMWKFLRELNASGTTIVLTTHYLEEAEMLSRHVAIIAKGNIVANEPMKDLLARHGDKKLEDIFLEMTAEEPTP
jgi:ABC-2 type transport system ATP-binding protein